MHISKIQIGDHYVLVNTDDLSVHSWIHDQFKVIPREQWDGNTPDLYMNIRKGYGVPLEDYHVDISQQDGVLIYARDDFMIRSLPDYRQVELQVHDDLALKHALMTIYSAFIVHSGWGLLIHSSCVVNGNKAYLFAGPSGAGKSTVAMLSRPREVLSDEATLIKIEPDRVVAYDSPFRSDSTTNYEKESRPLAAIHLLEQSPQIERSRISQAETVFRLMDKIFYWAHDPAETRKVLGMCRTLTLQVAAYNLKFQKNDLFWERIS
ncbi:hypothetical protein [Cohnella panacarvi]|uniref:hypothetical protein n=1 Tax=Cohnella panacarvi TaxID=400776 RepID=UPI0004797163|nr:hypothetical protein [Cohnella panacarvi]